ncbi:MAG TPA: DUF1269 domain-containing protein [Candidatus Saccharimonadia bacterium]
MSNLIVMTFADEAGAQRLMDELGKLQKEELIKLDDAATVIRNKNEKVHVKQARSLVGEGTLGGAFWGMLIGLLFFVPLAGLATGAIMGGILGKLSDYGINDQFIKEIGQKLTPGSSAVFLLVRDAQAEKVVEALKPYRGEIIHTSLSPSEETALKEAFASA